MPAQAKAKEVLARLLRKVVFLRPNSFAYPIQSMKGETHAFCIAGMMTTSGKMYKGTRTFMFWGRFDQEDKERPVLS
jgi:hypothetical protein